MPENQAGQRCRVNSHESRLTKAHVQNSSLQGLYLRNMLTLKRLNAGGSVGSVIRTQACLTHIATAPRKHSSLLAYHQRMLTTTRYLIQQQAFSMCPQQTNCV